MNQVKSADYFLKLFNNTIIYITIFVDTNTKNNLIIINTIA